MPVLFFFSLKIHISASYFVIMFGHFDFFKGCGTNVCNIIMYYNNLIHTFNTCTYILGKEYSAALFCLKSYRCLDSFYSDQKQCNKDVRL